jgi:PBP1b-binding outer membrane lipoprotein LpoB
MMKNNIQIIILTILLAGCSDRFRYPCQDPKNWETPECKPPICTATGTCPEMLIKPELEKK